MMRAAAILLLLAAATLAGGTETRDAAGFFNDTFGDFHEELANAREAGKKAVLIMFEMDECPFCHRMKRMVLNRADVQDYFQKHFLVFSVDTEGDLEITDFQGNPTTQKDLALKQFRVRATPVFQFVDLDGNPIPRGRYTGATRDAEEFLWFGEYVVDGRYADTSFINYKKAKRPAP
jgi:thioredoxin-related protein